MTNKVLEIIKEETPKGAKFTLKGRVDSLNADLLQLRLEETLKEGQTNIILNMFQVEYICSNGIRVILKTYKEAMEAGGSVKIEQPSEAVSKVLSLTSLDGMLTL